MRRAMQLELRADVLDLLLDLDDAFGLAEEDESGRRDRLLERREDHLTMPELVFERVSRIEIRIFLHLEEGQERERLRIGLQIVDPAAAEFRFADLVPRLDAQRAAGLAAVEVRLEVAADVENAPSKESNEPMGSELLLDPLDESSHAFPFLPQGICELEESTPFWRFCQRSQNREFALSFPP